MTPEQFVYWLQGYFEIAHQEQLKKEGLCVTQTDIIREHLAKVFNREPQISYGIPTKEEIDLSWRKLLDDSWKKAESNVPKKNHKGDTLLCDRGNC